MSSSAWPVSFNIAQADGMWFLKREPSDTERVLDWNLPTEGHMSLLTIEHVALEACGMIAPDKICLFCVLLCISDDF